MSSSPVAVGSVGLPLGSTAVDFQLKGVDRSEEHTSELQSQSNLVCRLLLEKKKKYIEHVPMSKICRKKARCSRSCGEVRAMRVRLSPAWRLRCARPLNRRRQSWLEVMVCCL